MIRFSQISNNNIEVSIMTSVSKIDNKYFINIENASTGDVTHIEITGRDPKNENVLHLPENPSNRQWLSKTKVDNAPNQVLELTYKESRQNGPIERAPKKPDRDYLSEDDQLAYDYLMNKIKEAKEAERLARKPKPLTEAEKLMKQIERLQARLAKIDEEGDK